MAPYFIIWSFLRKWTLKAFLSKKLASKGLEASFLFGAEDEIRTRDVHLGKVTLYHWATPAYTLNVIGTSGWNRTADTGIFSPLLYRLSYRGKWRPERGSNPRPPAWQAGILTNWTIGPFTWDDKWWALQGSNLWPSACKADALPAELSAHIIHRLATNSIIHESFPYVKRNF